MKKFLTNFFFVIGLLAIANAVGNVQTIRESTQLEINNENNMVIVAIVAFIFSAIIKWLIPERKIIK